MIQVRIDRYIIDIFSVRYYLHTYLQVSLVWKRGFFRGWGGVRLGDWWIWCSSIGGREKRDCVKTRKSWCRGWYSRVGLVERSGGISEDNDHLDSTVAASQSLHYGQIAPSLSWTHSPAWSLSLSQTVPARPPPKTSFNLQSTVCVCVALLLLFSNCRHFPFCTSQE